MWRQIPASHSVGVNFANPGQAIGRDAVTVRQTLDPGSPFEIYKSVLTEKYADFTGRARRAEYWWFVLVNLGVTIGISVVSLILASSNDSSAGLGAIIYIVYALGVFVPSLGRCGTSFARHQQEWLDAVDRIHPISWCDPAPRVLFHRRGSGRQSVRAVAEVRLLTLAKCPPTQIR